MKNIHVQGKIIQEIVWGHLVEMYRKYKYNTR